MDAAEPQVRGKAEELEINTLDHLKALSALVIGLRFSCHLRTTGKW